ncbi:LOW QUALITY PROTEIN: D-amino-acid transaminase, chloroplastic-like [Chenopodium quinoa]|uniref:LOW QUALITY PROTEIN: D-amino-acid transaminase, chloroplastic-like n=1 Tax=Chenopodium quinoa TaxID=63459 RepID=UPI000B77F32B|nr:LOW QUALITY PROTEIN: D-amino-acid transaminase, chloroplastic-like [Chenopodium quinoa]
MASWAASLRISPNQIAQNQLIYNNSFYQLYNFQFSTTINHPLPRFRLPSSHLGVVRLSNQAQSLINLTTPIIKVPLLSCEEAIERLRLSRERHKGKQQFLAMYSSIFGGITTDTAAMVIPMDDHMVHRGHGIFDTAAIVEGHLYELDQHLDRCVRSASMAKISLPFDREIMRSILIQTVSASKCRNGSLRYWLSAGHGDFHLSPSGCAEPTFYAIVTHSSASSDHKGIKVITSSIPIKPPVFATMKSVNYLPNALCQMEAEENGCFASIWLDSEGFVAEGPNMNVAFVTFDKELMMPRFDKILSGCTAKRILTLSQELVKKGDIRGVSTRDVSVEEGKKAEEMMLFGSGVLVRPIVQWDDQVIGNGNEGPVARALLELLLEDMKSGPSTVRTPIPY